MKDSKYIFLCSTYPPEYDDFYRSLSGCDSTTSGNIHSLSIIRGFEKLDKDYFVISGVGVGHYPLNTKTKKLPNIKFGDNFYSVGYNNHVLVCQNSKARAMYKCFKKYCSDKDKDLNVLLADIHEPFAKAALKIKRKYKNVTVVNICLDVPDTIVSSKSGLIRRFLKKISIKRNLKLLKKMDGFVLLSDAMKNRLPIYNKPYIVSPCISDLKIYNGMSKKLSDKTIIAYCGVLSKQYNIDLLIDAFSKIKDDKFELFLAGKGDGVALIEEAMKKDSRIKYLGELTREEALQIQYSADILVNPRLPEDKYTSYSFPSKTLSYLLSGNPVVCYTFSSFPPDIKSMVFIPKDLTCESLAEEIMLRAGEKSKVDFEKLKKYTPDNFIINLDSLFQRIRNQNE